MTDPAVAVPGRELQEIARTMRGALGSLRAAAETLEKFPGLEGSSRTRLLAVVSQESERLGDLVCLMEQIVLHPHPGEHDDERTTTALGELLAALAAAGAKLGYEVEVAHREELLASTTLLDVPRAQAVGAVAAFLGELRREMAVSRLRLDVRQVDHHLLFDLGWSPEAADLSRLLDWQGEALDAPPVAPQGAGTAERRGLRPLARDHDGEAWFILDRDGSAAHVKVLLPLAEASLALAR